MRSQRHTEHVGEFLEVLAEEQPCHRQPLRPAGTHPAGKEWAGQGARHAGPGLPPRPWWAPKYPSSLGKAGPHSIREGGGRHT